MPLPNDVRRGPGGRYQRYVGHGEYVDLAYKSERHLRRSQVIGEFALLAMPIGWGIGVARRVHYGIKGVRRIKTGKFGGRYYDTVRRKFISRAEYRSRFGLPRTTIEAAKLPHRMYKSGVQRAYRRFPRTTKWARRVDFARDPSGFLKRKYIPYYGFFTAVSGGYGLYRTYVRPPQGDESIPGITRVPPSFNRLDRLGEPLPAVPKEPYHPHRPSQIPSQSRRCPPGHRWSSSVRRCVPLRKNRS